MKKTLLIMLAALMAIAGTSVVAGATFTQTGTPDCVIDPEDQDDPRGDIVRYCAVMDDTGAPSFAMDVRQATDPGSDPAWVSRASYWTVDIETTGDAEPDYRFRYDVEGGLIVAEIVDLAEFTSCTGVGSVEGNQYRAVGFAASCVGDVTSFRSGVTQYVYNDGADVFELDTTGAVLSERGSDLPAPLDSSTPPPPPPAPPGDGLAEAFRLEGPSRFETAIAISQFQFPSGASHVYLSRSDEFADSISSGSLTGGPILLVPQCGAVPAAILAEVERLSPERVVALGGVAAVCDQVLQDVLAAANR